MADHSAPELEPVDKYALSDAWANGAKFKEPFDYTIERTQQTVFLHRIDMGDLLKLGIAEEMDFMSKELITGDSAPQGKEAVSNAILKASNFANMEKMINKVVCAGLIKPRLHYPPESEAQKRQAGLIYADSIPFDDRMELFSIIFDSEGLSTFRSEQEAGVGDVEHEQVVQLPADGPVDELRPEDAERVLSQ